MLREASAITSDPERQKPFITAQDRLIPDPAEYASWFAQADEKRRRRAVGSRRYSEVRDQIGAEPDWADFVDHETGDLVPVSVLRQETPAARAERTAKVKADIAASAKDIRQVATFGFR